MEGKGVRVERGTKQVNALIYGLSSKLKWQRHFLGCEN